MTRSPGDHKTIERDHSPHARRDDSPRNHKTKGYSRYFNQLVYIRIDEKNKYKITEALVEAEKCTETANATETEDGTVKIAMRKNIGKKYC